jgi:predicted O-linked N-acetylglucosamine transferase (SPINDLY family)
MTQHSVQQVLQIAIQHHQAGQLPQAEALYRQILGQQPTHADALHLLGALAQQLGRNEVATDYIGRALALNPNWAEAHSNLGNALSEMGRIDESIAAYKKAIALKPKYAAAYNNLGNALKGKGQWDDAIAAYRQAIALDPNYADAHNNLGNVLVSMKQLDEAIAAYRHAITLKPNFAITHNNLGNALWEKGKWDEAIAECRQAIVLKPDLAIAHYNLGNGLKDRGHLDEAIASYRQAVAHNPNYPNAHSNLVYTLHFHPNYDPHAIYQEACRWNQQHAQPLRQFIKPHSNSAGPERRLRIGYVSPDFRDHVIGRNILPLFRNHDKARFEIICYSQVFRPDAVTAQFQQTADIWRNIVPLSDEQLSEQIYQDHVDILVDMTLHMAGNRLLVFARKPAPVQVTYAGYPGSTGLTAIDYRLSDPYLDPPGMDESIYSEKTIRLPDSFWCYDPLEERHTSANSLPAAKNKYITFGCLNNFCKINEGILLLWAHIMRQVEESRLKLMAKPGDHRQRTIDFLAQHGIRPGRVEFFEGRPRREYLKLYHRVDVGLDSFPYNGHTTSLDSLWMGVPVVTLVGQTVVSRAGWCQLSNLGLTELAAQTPEQYVKIAVQLAGDLPRLKELRSTLRKRMEASPLMDAPRFARNIEAAYRQMWRTWCAKADG